jgi:hypothetical protein
MFGTDRKLTYPCAGRVAPGQVDFVRQLPVEDVVELAVPVITLRPAHCVPDAEVEGVALHLVVIFAQAPCQGPRALP